jgi:hypothetical protein
MATTTIPIQAKLFWLVAQDARSRFWVAQCPPLQIVAEGETYHKLVEAMNDCIQALFSELVQTGDFENFLREHGWKMTAPLPAKIGPHVRFDVPYEIERRSAHDFAAVCN